MPTTVNFVIKKITKEPVEVGKRFTIIKPTTPFFYGGSIDDIVWATHVEDAIVFESYPEAEERIRSLSDGIYQIEKVFINE